VGWIELSLGRNKRRDFVKAAMNIRLPQDAGNFLPSRETTSFSRTLHIGISQSVGRSVGQSVGRSVSDRWTDNVAFQAGNY
jgi:hypothetical protein